MASAVRRVITFFSVAHPSQELMLHRLSIVTQLGWVLVDARGRSGWYARVGGHYDITKNLFG